MPLDSIADNFNVLAKLNAHQKRAMSVREEAICVLCMKSAFADLIGKMTRVPERNLPPIFLFKQKRDPPKIWCSSAVVTSFMILCSYQAPGNAHWLGKTSTNQIVFFANSLLLAEANLLRLRAAGE